VYKYARTRAPEKPVLNVVSYWRHGKGEALFAPLVEEFQKQHPGIEVRIIDRPPGEARADLAAASGLNGKKPAKGLLLPDLVVLDQRHLASLGPENFFEDLGVRLEDQGLTSELMLDVSRGPRWTVPLISFMYTLYYNISVLREAGFDRPPKTREEFLAYARTLSGGGYDMALAPEFPCGEELGSWTWAGGLNFFGENQDALNTRALDDALNFIALLRKEGFLSSASLETTEAKKFDDFIAGTIGMMIAPVAGTGYIGEHAPELEYSITAVPPPAAYIGRPRFALNSWSAGIAKQSAHKDLAWLFISFLAGTKANAYLAGALSGIPANINARGTIHTSQGLYEKALAILEAGEAVSEPAAVPGGPALEKALREAAVSIIGEEKSPAECIKALEESWDTGSGTS
jgi:ABC-type glycerol-3-phosphate transport system substrate-binding protein